MTAEVLQGRPDGLRYGVSPGISDGAALERWPRDLDRLAIEIVLPTHGPPARRARGDPRGARPSASGVRLRMTT